MKPAVIKKQTEADEAQAEMFQTIVETILPMVTPLIKPATKKFEEFMNDDNMVFIRAVKGKVHIFHVKASEVDAFELKEGKKPVGIYSTEDFVNKLLSGNFSDL